MKILVLDTAASESGALTVLKNVMTTAEHLETDIEWHFIVSQNFSSAYSKIHILEYPWAKKSWFHRLYFDYIVLPRIIKEEKYDKILSLQNTKAPRTKVKQYIYLHQSIPFAEYRFPIYDIKMWIYQNVISKLIINSIKKAKLVFVQTHWMKRAISQHKYNIDEIIVISPSVDTSCIKQYKEHKASYDLFYPATAFNYKNHKILLDASRLLSDKVKRNISFTFTLNGDENEEIKEIKNEFELNNINVNWIGVLNKDEIFNIYATSTLIFPSYIETYGLPLLEARLTNTYILASDTLFSHEILDNYPNKDYFKYDDINKLAELLHTLGEKAVVKTDTQQSMHDSWKELLEIVALD